MSKKIVFVTFAVENLAAEFLSSYLVSKGHQAETVFDPRSFQNDVFQIPRLAKIFDVKQALVNQVVSMNPDVVGFSMFTINYQRALVVANLLKKALPNVPVIFGGIHPTSVPELVIKEKSVDMVCVGEGEEALLELLNSIKNGRVTRTDIKNIWFKKDGQVIKNDMHHIIEDLDSLPFPDKDIFYRFYPGFMDDYYTISSRGCPFSCTYCANNVIRDVNKGLGKLIRRRSPKNIVEELAWAKKRYNLKKLTFVDDVFVQDIVWLKEFAKLYKKKVGIPYAMITHPKFVTYDIAKTLKDSNCYFLLFGVQSASEKIRRKILERFETNDEIRTAAKSCHRASLHFSIDHIFNIPGETINEYVEAMHFYNELRPSVLNAYRLQFFPKTKIIDWAIKYGILKKSAIKKIEQGKTSTSIAVGFGNKDMTDPENVFSNIQLFFMFLPIIPQKVATKIINSGFYKRKLSIPLLVVVIAKFFVTILNNRGHVYFWILKSTFYFLSYDIKLKLKYARA